MEKLSCRNVWGPGRKTFPTESVIKTLYGTNSTNLIRDDLEAPQERLSQNRTKIQMQISQSGRHGNYWLSVHFVGTEWLFESA